MAIANDGHNGTIDYVYDASGTKLEKNVSTDTKTEYCNGYVYENGQLQFFPHPEGYVNTRDNGFGHVYQCRDHLGNVRLSYAEDPSSPVTPAIIEESNYYPFGLKHRGYNSGGDTALGNDVAQNWSYNGKELDESLGLNTYDFGARNYNPDLGRWMNIDPLAARYDSYSPYSFVVNNPLYFIDPDGKRIVIYYTQNGKKKQYEYTYDSNRSTDDLPEFLANAITALDNLYTASNIDTNGDGEINTDDVNPLDFLINSKKELSIVKGFTSRFNKDVSKRSENRKRLKDKFSDIGTVIFDDEN